MSSFNQFLFVFLHFQPLWFMNLQVFLLPFLVVDGEYKNRLWTLKRDFKRSLRGCDATKQKREHYLLSRWIRFGCFSFLYLIYLEKYRSTLLKLLAFYSTDDHNVFWLRKNWYLALNTFERCACWWTRFC